MSEFEGWATEHVRGSCRVSNGAESVTVLGTINGGVVDHSVHFSRLVAKVTELHEAIDSVSDSAVELILKRKCIDVSKIV